MIQIENVGKAFASQTLYRKASFSIGESDKVALLGPNGAGKTTFFKMLMGEELPDEGSIRTPKQFRLKVLRQEWEPEKDASVLDVCLMQYDEWYNASKNLEKLKHELKNKPEMTKVYAQEEEMFLSCGGYAVEQNAKEMLAGLGFKADEMDKKYSELSGGWRMRVQLAGLLVSQPDALLLDEPTNHLDVASVSWFESFLKYYPRTVLMITHDRRLAEEVCDTVLDFSPPQLTKWPYGVKRFETEKALRMEVIEAEIQNKQKEVAKLEDFVRRFKAKASKARQAQSKLKSQENVFAEMERLKQELPMMSKRPTKFKIQVKRRVPKVVTHFQGAVFGYVKEKPLFELPECLIEGGKSIGVIGDNGVGKSTFLKTLAGEIKLLAGEQKSPGQLNIGYFAQHRMEELPLDYKAIDYVFERIEGKTITQIRSVCGALGLREIDLDKDISVLSGGEKSRLSLSIILLNDPELLLLDEPTNHLDMEACDALVTGLKSFEGTLVVVSHNRDFLDASCSSILEIQPGQALMHLGTYSEWKKWKENKESAEAQALQNMQSKNKGSSASKPKGKKTKEQKRLEALQRAEKSKERKQMKNTIEELEAKMQACRDELKQLDLYLADPESPKDQDFPDKLKLRGETQQALERYEFRWLELSEKDEKQEKVTP